MATHSERSPSYVKFVAWLALVAFVAVILAVTVSALRWLFVVAAIALIGCLLAGFRSRNRPDAPLT
jgi:Flp pilus assembly protein TadB